MDRFLLQQILKNEKNIIEIGPFCNPFVISDNVKYFDVLNSEELKNRAEKIGGIYKERISYIPKIIHFVSKELDYNIINEKFSVAFSSHCVEHQPDLICHFNDISKILINNGSYYLFIPDKRYCFDHFKSLTTLSDVLSSHVNKNKNAILSKYLDSRLFSTHNNHIKHWEGEHGTINFNLDTIKLEIEKYLKSIENNEYIDNHNLHFIPKSFLFITLSLYYMEYIDLFPITVQETQKNENEFFVKMQKIAIHDKRYILKKIKSLVPDLFI